MFGSVLLAALALNFPIKTSLYDMVGMSDAAELSELRAGADDKVIVLCESVDPVRSRRVVQDFVDSLPVEYRSPDDVAELAKLPTLSDKVCREDAEALRTPEGRAKIAKRAIRRYVASPMPPLFKPEDDPFCLKERFLMSFATDRRTIRMLSLSKEIVNDIDRLIAVVDDLRGRIAAVNTAEQGDAPFVLSMTGVPVHTAVTAGECKRQIGWLTWFSLGFIALLSVFVFRSVKWIPLLALSLVVSCAAGAAAIFLCFDSVHLLTLVFGTTVLGLVIDYSFHWLLSVEHDAALRRNLTVSWVTTEISLLPLMLSSLPVLRQTAVFLAVALAAALAFVMFAYPKRAVVAVMLLCMFSIYSTGCDRVRTDSGSIYHAPVELAAADRMLAELWNGGSDSAEQIVKLYEEQGEKVRTALGLAELHYVRPVDTARPQRMLEKLLNDLTHETSIRLALALGCMFVALLAFFRSRAFRTFLPSVLAIGIVFGLVLVTECSVNLFHLLAMFLLAGMSIDYTVFLHNGGREARKPALCSLLTSMAGFGALYFVSFPVVSAFGFVLGLGLPLAFVLALTLVPRGHSGVAASEHAAFPLGMEILYRVYCLFGLTFLRFCAAVVGTVVWISSRHVRRASPRIGKVVNFTRSLADKLVVMAEGRSLPRVVTDGSEDAAAFLDDVRSGKGVFVLSSHVGTIEVLTALGECDRTFHAWMDFDRTGAFNRFYLRHAKRRRVVIHPISEFGMQTVFEAGDFIDAGDCLLMAGDRGDGAFRFAAAFDHPVYFVACLAEGGGYRAVVRRLPAKRQEMRSCYFEIVEELKRRYPEQWFEWNR